MELEYKYGQRITKLRHEMTALEYGISQYEVMAKEYINNYKNMANKHFDTDTVQVKEQREQARKKALRHLDMERAKLDSLQSVQEQLSDYRAKGMEAVNGTESERIAAALLMKNEEHHPTEVLENHMLAEGAVKPTTEHTAHHICPGKGKLQRITGATRMHLSMHGIRINDPSNGVYLLHKDEYTPHWSMPNSRGHLKYHTHEYERWVNRKILPLKNIDLIKTQLQVIGRILQDNEPKVAIGS